MFGFNRFSIAFILLSVLFGAFVFFGLSGIKKVDGVFSNSTGVSQSVLLDRSSNTATVNSDDVMWLQEHINSNVSSKKSNLSKNELDQIERWSQSRGRFRKSDLVEYESYNYEQLEKLSLTGDLKALAVLRNMILDRNLMQDSVRGDEYASMYNNSVKLSMIYGSTNEFYPAMLLKYPSVDGLSHEDVINALSIANVAALRGDLLPNISATERFKQYVESISAADYVKINENSLRIYEELERERIKLGLGSFDNTVPDPVAKSWQQFSNYTSKYTSNR